MVASKKSVDHRTEMNSMTPEILRIQNITEIFQKVEQDQKTISYLKTEEKETLLRRLYNIYPKSKSPKVKKDARARRSSNKVVLGEYDPSRVKVSVLDIFKEGLLVSPKLKTRFLTSIREMQPTVKMLSADSAKNAREFLQMHNISNAGAIKEEVLLNGEEGSQEMKQCKNVNYKSSLTFALIKQTDSCLKILLRSIYI